MTAIQTRLRSVENNFITSVALWRSGRRLGSWSDGPGFESVQRRKVYSLGKGIYTHFLTRLMCKTSTRPFAALSLVPSQIVIALQADCLIDCVKCCCWSGSLCKALWDLGDIALYKSTHFFSLLACPTSLVCCCFLTEDFFSCKFSVLFVLDSLWFS